jgi:hypothetical protein
MGDEVVMVGEDGPGFQMPAEIGGEFEQAALEDIEALWGVEEVGFLVSAGGDEVGAGGAETVGGGVRPAWACGRVGHGFLFNGVDGGGQMQKRVDECGRAA